MGVRIEVERTAEALEDGDCSGLVPCTAGLEQETGDARAWWVARMVEEDDRTAAGKHLTVYSPEVEGDTAVGVPCGSNTGRIRNRQPQGVLHVPGHFFEFLPGAAPPGEARQRPLLAEELVPGMEVRPLLTTLAPLRSGSWLVPWRPSRQHCAARACHASRRLEIGRAHV